MKTKPFFKRLSGRQKVFLLIIFLMPVLFLEIIEYFTYPVFHNTSGTNIEIPKGSALTQIADTLVAHKLLNDRDMFIFWTTYLGYETKLKAGHFTIPFGLNEYQLVEYLVNAKENTIGITFLEGWGLKQYADAIARKLQINSDEILKKCTDRYIFYRETIERNKSTKKN